MEAKKIKSFLNIIMLKFHRLGTTYMTSDISEVIYSSIKKEQD